MHVESVRPGVVEAEGVDADAHHLPILEQHARGIGMESRLPRGGQTFGGFVRAKKRLPVVRLLRPATVHRHEAPRRQRTVRRLPAADVLRRHLGERILRRLLADVDDRERGDEFIGRNLVDRLPTGAAVARRIDVGADVLPVGDLLQGERRLRVDDELVDLGETGRRGPSHDVLSLGEPRGKVGRERVREVDRPTERRRGAVRRDGVGGVRRCDRCRTDACDRGTRTCCGLQKSTPIRDDPIDLGHDAG